MVKYEEFKIFYDKHPDLDNSEYYAEFPETNKSTVRSWKNKSKPQEVPPADPPATAPAPPSDYAALEAEHIKMLIHQTQTKAAELEGLDNKSKLMILRNRIKTIEETTVRKPNSSILPAPKPASQTRKQYGIDEYIEFDKQKGEIRMAIPCDVLFDPEKNKGLGLIK